MKNRRIGAIILGILEIILGTLGGVFCLFILCYFFDMAQQEKEAELLKIFMICAVPLSSFLILIISGIGIVKLKRWAWKINIYLIPILFLSTIFIFLKLTQSMPTSIFARISNIIHPIFGLIFPLAIIVYLNFKDVKELFLICKDEKIKR